MPLGAEAPKLRPLGLGEIIGGAFDIYGKSFVQMVQLAAVVVIPLTILAVIIRRVTLPGDVFLRNGTLYTFGSTTSGIGGAIAQDVINVLSTWLAAGALFHLQLDTYLGRPHTAADSFAYFSHRIWQLILLGILVTITVAIGLVLFVIPGIWLGVGLAIAFPVLMLEGLNGTSAMGRSMNLVSGRWWVTFGRLIVAYLIVIVWIAIIGAIGGGIANGLSNVTVYEIVLGVTNAILFILVLPYTSAVINLIYLDLRVRKEGLTDEMLLERPRDPAHTVGAPATRGMGMPEAPPADLDPPAPQSPPDEAPKPPFPGV